MVLSEFIGLSVATMWLVVVRQQSTWGGLLLLASAVAVSGTYAYHLYSTQKSMACPGPDHPTLS